MRRTVRAGPAQLISLEFLMTKNFVFIAATLASAVTGCCMMDDEKGAAAPETPDVGSPDLSPAPTDTAASMSVEDEFLLRAKGQWYYKFKVEGAGGAAWVADVIEIDRNKHDITADVFADEARTTPLFRYQAKGTLQVKDRASAIADGFNIDIRLTSATLTALVDDPALFAAFGLDDCNLVANQPVDVMPTNCMVPLARDTTCTELELYQVAADGKSLDVGEGTNRYVERPVRIDRTRVPYTRLPF